MTNPTDKELTQHKQINVLLVEDSESDIVITKKTLEKHLLPHKLFVCKDGLAALNFLHNRPPYEDGQQFPAPDLVILDINMPNLDGHEVLEKIKEANDLKHVHVAILSSSRQEDDINYSYEKGAVSFVHKSLNDKELIGLLAMFNEYWKAK